MGTEPTATLKHLATTQSKGQNGRLLGWTHVYKRYVVVEIKSEEDIGIGASAGQVGS